MFQISKHRLVKLAETDPQAAFAALEPEIVETFIASELHETEEITVKNGLFFFGTL